MRKIKNAAVIFLMVYTIFANSIVSFAAEEGEQGYYLLYMYDQEKGASVEIGINQVITDQAYEEINMDNLIIFPIEGGVYHPFQMEQMEEDELTREIREYLLYAGYVRIDNESIAEDYELEAQEHAKSNGLGGWKKLADKQEYEQNSSEAQENEDEGRTDSNEENDNDKEIVPDANTKKDDVNVIVILYNKIVSYTKGWPWHIIIPCFAFILIIVCAVHKKRKKKHEKEKDLQSKNRYSNRY